MKTHALYPLTFHPIYRDYLWGGQRIAQRFNRANTPTPCAESWEVSGLDGAESIVAYGPFEGIGLGTLAQTFGSDLTGTKAPHPEVFPLLIKLLDAQTILSAQVHPDAAFAQKHGTRQKHEMVYLLESQPKSTLLAGLTPGATLKTLADHLISHEPHEGDVFDITPGLAHALGAGNLYYEVQQANNTTFRVHDWGRGRELHLKEAQEAIHWKATTTRLPAPKNSPRALQPRLITPDFTFATLNLQRTKTLHTTAQSFMIFFCVSGKTTLEHHGPRPLTLLPGDTVLLPPNQIATLHPLSPSQLLLTTL